jgi:hypothetical protein
MKDKDVDAVDAILAVIAKKARSKCSIYDKDWG